MSIQQKNDDRRPKILYVLIMHILIADSGSSKTDWRYIRSDKQISELRTSGLNPGSLNRSDISRTLNGVRQELEISRIDSIFFYSGGISTDRNKSLLTEELKTIFKVEPVIHSDLLGSCRAIFGSEDGICCILGTGSNAGYYDGFDVVLSAPSMGWILGDEGSGCHIGKKVLNDYFFDRLPEHIRELLNREFNLHRQDVLELLRSGKNPQKQISHIAEIIGRVRDEYVQKVVTESFNEFINSHLNYVQQPAELPIGFTGTIAYEFSGILRNTLQKHGLLAYRIIKNPIDELVKYHMTLYD